MEVRNPCESFNSRKMGCKGLDDESAAKEPLPFLTNIY
jgi:hypothetical protein